MDLDAKIIARSNMPLSHLSFPKLYYAAIWIIVKLEGGEKK
jgi:hypothetical protein